MQERAVPLLLTISCLFFLVATSLLAYVFLSRHASLAKSSLTAMPNSGLRVGDTFLLTGTGFGSKDLVTFTRDNNLPLLDSTRTALQEHTDAAGNFTVQLQVAPNWGVGQHTIYAADNVQLISASAYITVEALSTASPKLQLQLSHTTLDFGAGYPGSVSKQPIALTNAGGGHLSWIASSDSNWLTVTPNKGTLAGSGAVELVVNRGTRPGAYTGHVTFIQQGSNLLPLTLTVTMTIKAAPLPAANLVLSAASLTYSGSTTQNPAPESLTLQNTGGQPLNWSATTTTGDGASWLSMSPSSGILPAGTATQVMVSIQSQQLAPGSYTGTISFQGGANPQVVVSLTIVAPPNLALSTTVLSLSASQGQTSTGQIILSNNGGQPLDWTVNSSAPWLSVSSAQGHLDPAGSITVTATANAASLSANPYSGVLTFSYGTTTKQVAVNLTVSVPPMPGISVQPSSLVFNTTQGINPTAQTFTITNSGNATLDWATTEDANGTTYAATSSSSTTSSLAPSKSITITVTPKVASAGPGPITAIITAYDKDPGSTVPKQQVTVTINITPAAIINATPANMAFNEGNGVTSEEELLSIENTGSAPLNWSLAQTTQPSASWLSFDTPSGTIAPGTTFTVNVTCDSSQLSPGTYTATLVVSDSDPNSPVLSQTVTVTLVVS